MEENCGSMETKCKRRIIINNAKIKKQYPKKQKGFGKDPRIGVSIPVRDIITHGERIK